VPRWVPWEALSGADLASRPIRVLSVDGNANALAFSCPINRGIRSKQGNQSILALRRSATDAGKIWPSVIESLLDRHAMQPDLVLSSKFASELRIRTEEPVAGCYISLLRSVETRLAPDGFCSSL